MPGSGSAAERHDRLRAFFMGTPELAVPTLAALAGTEDVVGVATQPDRRSGRGRQTRPSAVKEWAIGRGIPVVQPETLRDADAVAAISSYRPDVIVVLAYGLLLPATVLAMPALGCVNVHTSLLPRHRGASPIQAAILAGDPVTGVTTMLMDEGLDTGPLLLSSELRVRPDDTAASLGARLAVAGADLAVRTLRELTTGSIEPSPQDEASVTKTTLLRKADGRIDWTRSAAEIDRRVRAMQPWPVAFSELGGARLQIWRVEPGPHGTLASGEVAADASGLRVGCGSGESVRILELQRAGGRRLEATEFLRGFVLVPSARFGDAAAG